MSETIIETKASFAALYQSLVDAESVNRNPPRNYFTIKQFADDAGINPNVASRRLNDMCESGSLSRERFLVNGSWTWCYWFIVDEVMK